MDNKIIWIFLTLIIYKFHGISEKFIYKLISRLEKNVFYELKNKIWEINFEIENEQKINELELKIMSSNNEQLKENLINFLFLTEEKRLFYLYNLFQYIFDNLFENDIKTKSLLILRKTFEELNKELKFKDNEEEITYELIKENTRWIKLWKFKQFISLNTTSLKNTIVVAWRYWVWKTIFSLNLITDIIRNNNDVKILYFWTEEVDTIQFIKRMMVSMSKEDINWLFYRLWKIEEDLNWLRNNIQILEKWDKKEINNKFLSELNYLNVLNLNEDIKNTLETIEKFTEKKNKYLEIKNANQVKKLTSLIWSLNIKLKDNLNWFKNLLEEKKTILNWLLNIINYDDLEKNNKEINDILEQLQKNEKENLFSKKQFQKISWIDEEWWDFIDDVIDEIDWEENNEKKEYNEFSFNIENFLEWLKKIQIIYNNQKYQRYNKFSITELELINSFETLYYFLRLLNNWKIKLKSKEEISNKLEEIVKIKNELEIEKNKIDIILKEEFNKVKMFIDINWIELYNSLNIDFIENKIKEAYKKYDWKKKLVFIWDYQQSIDPWKKLTEFELSIFVWQKALEIASKYNALWFVMSQLNDVYKKWWVKNSSLSYRPWQAEIRWWEWIAHKVWAISIIFNRDMANINELEFDYEIDANFVIYEIYFTKNRYWPDKYNSTRKYYILDKKKMNYIPINESVYKILDDDKEIIYLDQLKKIIKEKRNISDDSKLNSFIFSTN